MVVLMVNLIVLKIVSIVSKVSVYSVIWNQTNLILLIINAYHYVEMDIYHIMNSVMMQITFHMMDVIYVYFNVITIVILATMVNVLNVQ